MADTTFVAYSQSTKITAEWLNEVNSLVHKVFGNSASGLTTAELGIDANGVLTVGSATDITGLDSTYRGVVLPGASFLGYDDPTTGLEIGQNIIYTDQYRHIATGGASLLNFWGTSVELDLFSSDTAGATAGSADQVYQWGIAGMTIGHDSLASVPAGYFQVHLFGSSTIGGHNNDTNASNRLEILQNARWSNLSAHRRLVNDEATAIQMQDGVVKVRCAAADVTANSITWTDPLQVAITGVTVTNLTVTGTVTGITSSQWTTTASDIYYNTGKVGIGTTSPQYNLHIGPAATTSTIQLTNSNSNHTSTDGAIIQLEADRELVITNQENERIKLTVGSHIVGTFNSGADTLRVGATTLSTDASVKVFCSGATSGFGLNASSGFVDITNANAGELRFTNAGAAVGRITNGGTWFFGTHATAPSDTNKVHVGNSSSADTYVQVTNNAVGQTSTDGLLLGITAGGVATINAQDSVLNITSGSNAITIGGGATATELRFLEPSGSGTNYTAFKAQAQAGNVTYTLPAAAPTTNGQVLASTTGGTMSWSSAAGVGSGGQAWTDVSGSRSTGVTYTNSTGTPIQVLITVQASPATTSFYIGGVVVAQIGGDYNNTSPFSAIIPDGETYKITTSYSIPYWYELR